MQWAIPREKVPDAVSILRKKYKIIAPIQKGKSFVFAEVEDPAKVTLDYSTTILPLKKFFLPPAETLMASRRNWMSAQAITFTAAGHGRTRMTVMMDI